MRILLSTDNHLGFMEKDPVRSNDSFKTFEEILKIANDRDVDFILLGGDLFHDNRPSRKAMFNTMELLRRYCHGNRQSNIEIFSDSSVNFPHRFPVANFNDPHMNISMPVFSIHGNHDDPSGDGHLCALDLLSVAGLINYFGKSSEIENISVNPILLAKGSSKLALYGLGNIRDERLFRLYSDGKVRMLRPAGSEDCFNLLVLHQNRVAHGQTNYIPEKFISNFFDLVFWGHEHECVIDPCFNPDQQFYITQPGSSVATSLSEGESKTKHVGILTIDGKNFGLEKIRLKTVRPFIMRDIVLRDIPNLDAVNVKEVEKYLKGTIEQLIIQSRQQWLRENNDDSEDEGGMENNSNVPLPLIRIRVEYSEDAFNTYNRQRFGRMFTDRVANPNDILQLYRKRTATASRIRQTLTLATPGMPEPLDSVQLETLLAEFLKTQTMNLLPDNGMSDAVKVFVEKDDKDAIKEFIDKTLVKTRGSLNRRREIIREEEVLAEVENDRKIREAERQRSTDVSSTAQVSPAVPESASPPRVSLLPPGGNVSDDDTIEEIDGNRSVVPDYRRSGRTRTADDRNDDENKFIQIPSFDDDDAPAPRPRTRAKPASTSKRSGTAVDHDSNEDDIILVADSDDDEAVVRQPATFRSTKTAVPGRRKRAAVTVTEKDDSESGNESPAEIPMPVARQQSPRRKVATGAAATSTKKRQTSITAAFKQQSSQSTAPASKWPSRRRA